MNQRVNIINVASTQIQIYSLDAYGPTYSGGFKLKKHGKIVGRLTFLSSLGTNTLSLIKNKKLSKREQTEHEHHEKRQKLFVSSPK